MQPDTLVLDIRGALSLIHDVTRAQDVSDHDYIDQLIEGVMDCLMDRTMAISSLMTFADAQRYRHAKWYDAGTAQTLADGVMAFGHELVSQFEQFGVYREGLVDYTFMSRDRLRTLYLTRIMTRAEAERRS
ncbi:hypothetical protein [Paraburkholderia sp. BCC1886]|uniref:hypothetical protein n=1 Tax=Paraburkholderia sp. BCC1886 TaxID=2562670 RepID=UPI0011844057|nr:hypothetical protein [Paraburkholderia sp. BCC1886]